MIRAATLAALRSTFRASSHPDLAGVAFPDQFDHMLPREFVEVFVPNRGNSQVGRPALQWSIEDRFEILCRVVTAIPGSTIEEQEERSEQIGRALVDSVRQNPQLGLTALTGLKLVEYRGPFIGRLDNQNAGHVGSVELVFEGHFREC